MIIGYARVSTNTQVLSLQEDALKKAGCDRIFTDQISGAKAERPGLSKAFDYLREGDTLVVWRLDRLGRSLRDLIDIAEKLKQRGIGLKSLQEAIDTHTSGGQLIFHLFGALAEFERNLIRERVRAGLDSARARGRKGGRPVKLAQRQREIIKEMYLSKKYTLREIADSFKISVGSVLNYVKS